MFWRRIRVPAELTPPLDRTERVVAWASTSDGEAVVLTDLGLWLPGLAARLGWHEIHKATWDQPLLTVTPGEQVGEGKGYALMADSEPVAVALESPGDVPHQIRTRVTRSVVFTQHYSTPAGGVRVVGRKVPRADGLSWQVRPDAGTDLSTPEATEALADLVADLAAAHSADR